MALTRTEDFMNESKGAMVVRVGFGAGICPAAPA